jgi:hypothetical protein
VGRSRRIDWAGGRRVYQSGRPGIAIVGVTAATRGSENAGRASLLDPIPSSGASAADAEGNEDRDQDHQVRHGKPPIEIRDRPGADPLDDNPGK